MFGSIYFYTCTDIHTQHYILSLNDGLDQIRCLIYSSLLNVARDFTHLPVSDSHSFGRKLKVNFAFVLLSFSLSVVLPRHAKVC